MPFRFVGALPSNHTWSMKRSVSVGELKGEEVFFKKRRGVCPPSIVAPHLPQTLSADLNPSDARKEAKMDDQGILGAVWKFRALC